VARGAPRGPRHGAEVELHDALRARRAAEHRVDHLLRLRALQDETGGFNAFIPLAYHPENNYLGLEYHTTGSTTCATRDRAAGARQHPARQGLLGDDHAEAGAGGALLRRRRPRRHGGRETIYHMAGAETAQAMAIPELERVIREAGFRPVERDTLYNPIVRAA
jgi:aminodeoxyfutalosine synthase